MPQSQPPRRETEEHVGEMTAGSSVRVFGGVAVDGPDGPVSIGGPRQRRALLVVRLEQIATNDWLAEHLWSDDERQKTPSAQSVPTCRVFAKRSHPMPRGGSTPSRRGTAGSGRSTRWSTADSRSCEPQRPTPGPRVTRRPRPCSWTTHSASGGVTRSANSKPSTGRLSGVSRRLVAGACRRGRSGPIPRR